MNFMFLAKKKVSFIGRPAELQRKNGSQVLHRQTNSMDINFKSPEKKD